MVLAMLRPIVVKSFLIRGYQSVTLTEKLTEKVGLSKFYRYFCALKISTILLLNAKIQFMN